VAALAIVLTTASESHASSRRARLNQPAPAVAATQSSGPFARLMEMERRKNAALRQMFFGR
jgi:hypothetical protein